jgi:hypothetical protein
MSGRTPSRLGAVVALVAAVALAAGLLGADFGVVQLADYSWGAPAVSSAGVLAGR